MTAAEPTSSRFPRRFGDRYVLLKEIAKGGMGRVFLAIAGGRVCAVKTLHAEDAGPHLARRFEDEARIATALSHPNLVYVSEAGAVGRTQFLAMEYVRGKSLHDVLRRSAEAKRAIPIGLALFIARELLRALAYLHDAPGLKLVHRDVAPSNVMLSYEGGVKVIDLGLAKWRDKVGQTAFGEELGQARYSSPEQRRGDAVDARGDLFSVGVILWEMLTGRPLFRDGEARRQGDTIPRPSEVTPGLPRVLDTVVMTALAGDPMERFQSAQEALSAVTPHLSAEHDAGALQAFLAGLFSAEIAREQAEEGTLVSAASLLVLDAGASGNRPSSSETYPVTAPLAERFRARTRRLSLLALGLFFVVAAVGFAREALFGRHRRATEPRVALPTAPPQAGPNHPDQTKPAPALVAVPGAQPADAGSGAPARLPPARVIRRPDVPDADRLLGRAEDMYRAGRFTEALNLAERALAVPGGEVEGHLLLGKVNLQMELFDEALTHYEAALRLRPTDRAALRGRELARAGLGR